MRIVGQATNNPIATDTQLTILACLLDMRLKGLKTFRCLSWATATKVIPDATVVIVSRNLIILQATGISNIRGLVTSKISNGDANRHVSKSRVAKHKTK